MRSDMLRGGAAGARATFLSKRRRTAWRSGYDVYEIAPNSTRYLARGNGAHAYISMRGDFDIYNRQQLASVLERAAGSVSITLDLEGTTFIDAAILGVLVAFAARRREVDAARLSIIKANPHVLRLFAICGLQSLFHFEQDWQRGVELRGFARGSAEASCEPAGL